MINREIFQRDPVLSKLLNDGVAAVNESFTSREIETLRYELEHFVCEGQYKEGIIRILESYLGSLSSTNQPAVWVSGFYGSGKSHLLKMLRHLWVNTKFDSDGSTARGLAHLPTEIKDLLKELDTMGKRGGGLHAAAGALSSGGGESTRLAILSIILKSKDLPEFLPQALFILWLKNNGIFEQVKEAVEKEGKNFLSELNDLYVSPILAKALLDADPNFAPDLKQVRTLLRAQFPVVDDISTSDFIKIIRGVLTVNGQIPCTCILLDEIQLFIGDSAKRSTDVQEVAEALCKQLDSRVLLIGAGQTALGGDVPLLQRLKDRFTIPIELSDIDVETVTRRVVLAKRADRLKAVEEILNVHSGEIDRQLAGTRIAARTEDRNIIVEDYPILPVRRRFWEHVLRAVDIPNTNSQLRTQLRIVHDAVRDIADKPLGSVVPSDVVFDQMQPDLLRTGVLLREIDETIRNLDDGTPDGILAKRICGLIFLIRKLPREAVIDIGVRATPEIIADLLVSDLANDGTTLRKNVPTILEKLVEQGKIIKIEEEYSLQTRESNEWDSEFRSRQTKLNNDLTSLSVKRTALINAAFAETFSNSKLTQGNSKEPRKLLIQFGDEPPAQKGTDIPVWVRDGWGENETAVLSGARAAGSDSATVFVFIPKASAEDLKKAVIQFEAAKATIDSKGPPTTPEGQEARDAMHTRMTSAQTTRNNIIKDVLNAAKVFQGGGQERFELILKDKVIEAAKASMDRLFPKFRDADDNRWSNVINRAKNGDGSALQSLDWKDAPEKHPVCSNILSEIGSGKTGKEIRDTFKKPPFGWPQDAVDGALIVLFTTGLILAVHKGVQLKQGELDQAKISVTDFKAETKTIDVHGRIKLRKLFQTAGLNCKSGEESAISGQFLAVLCKLADEAGGEPPMPECPSKLHLENMQGLAGNEQLAAILDQSDTLARQFKYWTELGKLAAERKKNWAALEIMLGHAGSLPEAEELQKQADAVRAERRLLDKTDPVPAILKDISTLLRTAVKQAHSSFENTYNLEMEALLKNDNWKRLAWEQQKSILETEGIDAVPELSVGDDKALLSSIKETPLPNWKTKRDALQKQFNNAALAAARLLEPKTIEIKLTSGTLKTDRDVKEWITKTEKNLLENIKNGPLIVN